MPHRSDESLFAAFQAHRDCQALGLLFHRRAEELLRLAAFLAPRPCDAEDLVQATFLAAIARAETFRPGHRVMAWLCGILTNQARMVRRARQRARVGAPPAAAEDPVDAALRGEVARALRTGIAALPEPYRSVLALHLEDGLDSRAISERLARPAATVRKQMERALDRLRTSLPHSLTVGILARVDTAALARKAADAAEFVEPAPTAASGAVATGPGLPWRWLLVGTAATLALVVFTVSRSPAHARPAPDAVAATTAARAGAPPAAAVVAELERTPGPASTAPATPATQAPPEATLVVRVADPAGATVPGVDVQVIVADGRALPERLTAGTFATQTSDEHGIARFVLPPGTYDVTFAGAAVKDQVRLADGERTRQLEVPFAMTLGGLALDANGRPVAGVELVASESSLRGDLGTVIARSRADGSFQAETRLGSGRLFARHPEFADGIGARLEPHHPLRFALTPARRTIDARVVDADGEPIAGAYVALVPRSFAMSLFPLQHGRTDATGAWRFHDPGAREATVLASLPGCAPSTLDLEPSATAVELVLAPGGELTGRVVDAAGAAMPDVRVLASIADQRSNEPVAPLVAREVRTDAAGRFAFAHLPGGSVQVRVQGTAPSAPGLLPFPHVLAAADVAIDPNGINRLELTARFTPVLRGRLVTRSGAPVAGWNVLATPMIGTALHRGFRARGAPTDADGRFAIVDLAPGEDYQLGVVQPGAPRRRDGNTPFAFGVGRPGGEPVELAIDPQRLPRARLRARVLNPGGQPCVGASLELRALRFHGPVARPVADDGTCEFGPLAAGDYWLAISAPGLGMRTLEVHVADDQEDVDLGTITLDVGARATVRLHSPQGTLLPGARVIAMNLVGDKSVAALTDANGRAELPVLPPGDAQLVVHGPGLSPVQRVVQLAPGQQEIDVEAEAGVTVPMHATFALAENPFTVNGPLHVQIWRGDALVLEDYLGAVSARGQFDLTTGLPPGDYRVVARALWNARAEAQFVVTPSRPPAPVTLRLARTVR